MEKYKKGLAIAAGFGIVISLIAFAFKKRNKDYKEKFKKKIRKEADKILKEADELEKKILQNQRNAANQNFIE